MSTNEETPLMFTVEHLLKLDRIEQGIEQILQMMVSLRDLKDRVIKLEQVAYDTEELDDRVKRLEMANEASQAQIRLFKFAIPIFTPVCVIIFEVALKRLGLIH